MNFASRLEHRTQFKNTFRGRRVASHGRGELGLNQNQSPNGMDQLTGSQKVSNTWDLAPILILGLLLVLVWGAALASSSRKQISIHCTSELGND